MNATDIRDTGSFADSIIDNRRRLTTKRGGGIGERDIVGSGPYIDVIKTISFSRVVQGVPVVPYDNLSKMIFSHCWQERSCGPQAGQYHGTAARKAISRLGSPTSQRAGR